MAQNINQPDNNQPQPESKKPENNSFPAQGEGSFTPPQNQSWLHDAGAQEQARAEKNKKDERENNNPAQQQPGNVPDKADKPEKPSKVENATAAAAAATGSNPPNSGSSTPPPPGNFVPPAKPKSLLNKDQLKQTPNNNAQQLAAQKKAHDAQNEDTPGSGKSETREKAEAQTAAAASLATKKAIQAGTGVDVDKIPGAGKAVDKAVEKNVKVAFSAATVAIGMVLVIVVSLFGGTIATVIGAAFTGNGFPLPPPATPFQTSLLPYDQDEVEEGETIPKDRENRWEDVLYDAQETSKTNNFGVPWTVLAGLARVQTDFGRNSPYDNIDRDDNRHSRFGTSAAATGSSGEVVAATVEYTGRVLILGDARALAVAGGIQAAGTNPVTNRSNTTGTFSTLNTQLAQSGSIPEVIYIVVGENDNPPSAESIKQYVSSFMTKVPSTTTVIWANYYDPKRPAVSNYINTGIAQGINGKSNAVVHDIKTQASQNATTWFDSNGKATQAGKDAITRLAAARIKQAPTTAGFSLPIDKGKYRLSAWYNKRGSAWSSGYHTGQDFAAPQNTPVKAISSGTITKVDTCNCSWYGYQIEIQHAGGLKSTYSHLYSIAPGIQAGMQVQSGQHIAGVGTRGNSSGNHLHLEAILNGKKTDPMQYLPTGGASNQVASLGNVNQTTYLAQSEETSCEVSTIEPAIGGTDSQGVGLFLIKPSAAKEMEEDGLNPQNPCDQANFVAEKIVKAGSGLPSESEYDDWENNDDQAKKMWEEAIARSGIFVDPSNPTVSCKPTVTTDDEVANAIAYAINCEANNQSSLHVVDSVSVNNGTVTFATLDKRTSISQLTSEALTVAWNYSGQSLANCDNTATYAGVFPLTAAEATAAGLTDRCDPAGNIAAAAKLLVEGEAVEIDKRSTTSGPYQPMLGGWNSISWALGTQREQFTTSGPLRPWTPNEECADAINNWMVLAANTAALDGIDPNANPSGFNNVLNTVANPPSANTACETPSNVDIYHALSLASEGVSDDPEATTQTKQRAQLIGAHYAELAATNTSQPLIKGTDIVVDRLAVTRKTIPAPEKSPQYQPLPPFPVAQQAVTYAVGYGGIRPEWDTADESVLQGTSVAGVGSLPGGDVETVINAAMTQIGVDYSWGGGGPSGPSKGIAQGANTVGFDCSGLVQYAFAKAGYNLGGTTRQQINDGTAVAGGMANAIRGDILLWTNGSTPYHVAIYLGDNKILEAPRTGLKVRATDVYHTSKITSVRRIVPEGAGSTAGGNAGFPTTANGAALRAKIQADGGGAYAEMFVAAGQKHNVNPALLAAIASKESGFNPNARSYAGAVGLMQFMPATAAGMGLSNPADPAQSIEAGARYMRQLLNGTNGDIDRAVLGYNRGAGGARTCIRNLGNRLPQPGECGPAPYDGGNYIKSIKQNAAKYGFNY